MDIKESRLHEGGTARHPWEIARLALVRKLLKRFLPLPNKVPRAILDIGGGDLFVARRLAEAFPRCRVMAVDPALDKALAAALDPGAAVAAFDRLEDIPVVAADTDVVLLLDVLEHVDDDEKLLRQASFHPAVASGALVLISAPAFRALFTSHDRFLDHKRRYRRADLEALAGRAGLKTVASGYLFLTLWLVRLLQAALERTIGPRRDGPRGVAGWRGGNALSGLLAFILRLDGEICFILRPLVQLPGLSCYAVCRRPA